MATRAFYGAYGWGAEAAGGRGGTVLQVTNLNDSGAGSFRAAAEQSGTRIIVFTIAGEIDLQTHVSINDPNITIAGQTAPGNGIYFTGKTIRLLTNNVIIRYLKYRGNNDVSFLVFRPFSGPVYDIIIDHCSTAWNTDDCIDIWHEGDVSGYEGNEIYNITVQNCLITESATNNGKFAIVSGDYTNNGKNLVHHISFLNNLFTSGNYRMPYMTSKNSEIINNVTYNDKWYPIGFGDEAEVDIVNNYGKVGLMGDSLRFIRDNSNGDEIVTSIYLDGNVFEGTLAVGEDNWPHVVNEHAPGGIPDEGTHRRLTRLDSPNYPVPVVSAADAYENALNQAGAYQRLNSNGSWIINRDTLDARIIDEIKNNTGIGILIADASAEIPPTIISGTAYTDTDSDGMPDDWERANGLNLNNAADGSLDADYEGYTNLEMFLNGKDYMSGIHVYLGIENINLNALQKQTLINELKALGPTNDSQPARLCHWRTRLDNEAAIFEALFDEDNLTIAKFKQRLGSIFSVDPSTISHSTSQKNYAGFGTSVVTFTYGGTNYLRFALFGNSNASWMQSGDECRGYLKDNQDEWNEIL